MIWTIASHRRFDPSQSCCIYWLPSVKKRNHIPSGLDQLAHVLNFALDHVALGLIAPRSMPKLLDISEALRNLLRLVCQ